MGGDVPPREIRQRKLAELDAALRTGMADIEAGRFREADEVFDELDAELTALSDDRAM